VIQVPTGVRDSSAAEIQAFEDLCQRLYGFDQTLSFEYIDGWLTALAAGPRLPPGDAWIAPMLGDTFERVFADESDAEHARRVLGTRLKVLCAQLDPEALLAAPEQMRLSPLISHWPEEEVQQELAKGTLSAEQAALLVDGGVWADGFLQAVHVHTAMWAEPSNEEDADHFGTLIDQVAALTFPAGHEAMRTHADKYWRGQIPSRDELIGEACYAVQDLRIYWVNQAPKPTTLRLGPKTGRNEPCPCGSGKKYKKCHGQDD
jgi:uncharacterized protein